MNLLIVLAVCNLIVASQENEWIPTICKDLSTIYEAYLGKEVKLEFLFPMLFENMEVLKTEIRGPSGNVLCKYAAVSDSVIDDSSIENIDNCETGYNEYCYSCILTMKELKLDRIGKWNMSITYGLKDKNNDHIESYTVDVYGIEFDDTFHNKSFEVKEGEIIAAHFPKVRRNDTTCRLIRNETGQEYDLDADLFVYPRNDAMIERINFCGFRMVVDETSEGNWSLVSDFGWIKRRAYFGVIINPSITRTKTEIVNAHQTWFDDLYSSPSTVWHQRVLYIEMERPDKKVIRQDQERSSNYISTHVTEDDEGRWKIRMQLLNEKYMMEQYIDVVVEDLPIFSWNPTSVDVNRMSHQLTLQVNYLFNICGLKNQDRKYFKSWVDSTEIFKIYTIDIDQFTNLTTMTELEISCIDVKYDGDAVVNGLIIMGDRNSPMNDKEISPVWQSIRRKHHAIRGDELKVKCIASRPLTNCTLVSPNGTRYMQNDNSSLLIEKKCSRGEGICGWVKIIKNVEEIRAGNWTCEMDLEGGRRIESIVPVDVREFPIITHHEYSRNGDINLYCYVPHTMLYARMRSCRWFDSHENLIPNIEESEKISDVIASRIILNVSRGGLSGIFKCAVKFDKYIKGEVYGYFNLSEILPNAPYRYLERVKDLTDGETTTQKISFDAPLNRYLEQKKDSIEEQGKSPKNVGVILYSLAVVMIILTMGILISYKCKRGNPSAGLSRTKAGPLNPEEMLHEQADFLPYDEERWEYPENKLQMGKKLGNGFFGFVVEALAPNILKDGKCTRVAVKKLQSIANLLSDRRDLEIELKILANLPKHPNIVNLLGACTKSTAPGGLLVILEFCDLGNLLNYIIQNRSKYIDLYNPSAGMIDVLKSKPDTQQQVVGNNFYSKLGDSVLISQNIFSTQDLLTWSLQAARGMDYLSKKNVLHGDLAARNILLTDERVAKICDFGLARTIPECDYYRRTGSALPLRWMALESLLDRKFSIQSDVWSFGVVLWECFTLGKSPYEGEDALKIVHNLGNGERLGMPDYATDEIYNIMRRCWNLVPSDRPSFSTIIQDLDGIIDRVSEKSRTNMRNEL